MTMSTTSGSTRSSVQSHSSVSSEMRLSALDDVQWYHPNIDRHIAETLLLNNAREGSFLLRDKSNGTQGYDFVLSVRAKDAVNHYECKWDGKNYCFGFGSFKGLQEFHDHLMTQTLLAGENGVLTVLKHPYPRDVREPSLYDTVRIHASMGRNRSIVHQPNLSVATKEGFLTKQGGRVKNWKTRWFTVQGRQMKYFKDRSDKDPIRTLDLAECSEVKADNTHKDRDHCFSVKFSWRTFYFCASTHQEALEWIQLLNWKLQQRLKAEHHQDHSV